MKNFSNYFLSNKLKGIVCTWLVLFLSFGFPISTSVPIILGLSSSRGVNMSFRAVYLGVALYLILATLFQKRSQKFKEGAFWLIAFLVLYGTRVIYDMSVYDLSPAVYTKFYVSSFLFGNILIPVIAIFLNAKFIDLKTLPDKIFGICLFSNIMILSLFLKLAKGKNILAARALLELDNGKSEKTYALDPISIAKAGEVLALVSIAMLILSRTKGKMYKFIIFIALCLGLVNLVIGASRGPFLSFALILIFLILQHFRSAFRLSVSYISKLVLIVACVLSLIIFKVLPLLEDSALFNRIGVFLNDQTGGDDSLSERSKYLELAWSQFTENPILGDQFVIREIGAYPHNIILETLMATGVIGASLFLIAFLFYLHKGWLISRKPSHPVFIVFILSISALLGNVVSGNLYTGVPFWITIASFLCLEMNYKSNRIRNIVSL